MNPERRTAMFRVLQVDGERVRLVRSSKAGEIHSMARDKNGQWKSLGEIAGWQVIGHYGQAPKKAPKAGAVHPPAPPATKPAAKRNSVGGGSIGHGTLPAQSGGRDLATYLRAQVSFHEASANAAKQQLKELTTSGRR